MFGRIVILWQIIPIGVKLNRQEKNMEAKIVFGKPITIQLQDGMMRLVSGSIMPMVMGNNMLCVNLRIKHLSSIFIEISKNCSVSSNLLSSQYVDFKFHWCSCKSSRVIIRIKFRVT